MIRSLLALVRTRLENLRGRQRRRGEYTGAIPLRCFLGRLRSPERRRPHRDGERRLLRTERLRHSERGTDGRTLPFTWFAGRSNVDALFSHGEPRGGRAGLRDGDGRAVFLAATIDKTLRHYYRSPESVDWEVEEVDVPAGTAEQVVWYTTKAAVLDAESRGLNNVQVILSCAETTEIVVNGRPDLVGPGRSVVLETSAVGNLVIQQSTAELGNLYVPQLKLDLYTGETATLSPQAASATGSIN